MNCTTLYRPSKWIYHFMQFSNNDTCQFPNCRAAFQNTTRIAVGMSETWISYSNYLHIDLCTFMRTKLSSKRLLTLSKHHEYREVDPTWKRQLIGFHCSNELSLNTKRVIGLCFISACLKINIRICCGSEMLAGFSTCGQAFSLTKENLGPDWQKQNLGTTISTPVSRTLASGVLAQRSYEWVVT